MDDCYDEKLREFKCGRCAFSNDTSLTCASPAIRETPPRDSYFIVRGGNLSNEEKYAIDRYLD